MILTRHHLNKFEALVATGMPGAYRLIIFFALECQFGLSTLGNIASWQSTAQILGFFTAIGWCTLILVRIPKSIDLKDKIQNYNSLLLMGLTTLTTIVIILIVLGYIFKELETTLQISLWLAAWTFYQIPRHYLIAQRKYRQTLLLDSVIIITSIAFIFISIERYVSYGLAICMLLTAIAANITIQHPKEKPISKRSFEVKGLEYGLINFLSGGIALSLIPLANYYTNSNFAGALSLFVAFSGIALLIPRAISTYRITELSRNTENQKKYQLTITKTKKDITLSNIATTIVLLIYTYYTHTNNAQINSLTPWLTIAILTITLQYAASTQTLIYSNILQTFEITKETLKLNLLCSILFTALCIALYDNQTEQSLTMICATSACTALYRYFRIKSIAKKIINKARSSPH